MYAYTEFDRHFVCQRAAQYRDQLQRHLAGELPDEDFRPLRLQNGWYVQRHAPMLRVAVPYGELSSQQLRQLARIAREFRRVTSPGSLANTQEAVTSILGRMADRAKGLAAADEAVVEAAVDLLKLVYEAARPLRGADDNHTCVPAISPGRAAATASMPLGV